MVDKPKIIEHVVKSLDYTLFDARWIPCSARFVVLGNYARGTGAFQIYEVSKGDVKLLKSVSACCCNVMIKGLGILYLSLATLF